MTALRIQQDDQVAECKLGQGELLRAKIVETLLGAVRLASAQDQPLKQLCMYYTLMHE
jgi:hypothetical protein